MADHDLLAVADEVYLRHRRMGDSEAVRVEAVTNAVEAEVRERIAQDIERTTPKMKADPYLLISIEHAARIARGGESE